MPADASATTEALKNHFATCPTSIFIAKGKIAIQNCVFCVQSEEHSEVIIGHFIANVWWTPSCRGNTCWPT